MLKPGPALTMVALLAALCPAAAADPGASASADTRERVRRAALTTWVHGITEEIALREVGADASAHLLELLADPDFPRRDNVVAHLAFVGDASAAAALREYLLAPPGSLDNPDEERALLLAPQAAGHLARRGVPGALELLLEMTEPGAEGGPLATAASAGRYPEPLRDDLVEMAVRGLGLSGAERAVERLVGLSEGSTVPVVRGRDLGTGARRALELAGRPRAAEPGSRRGAAPRASLRPALSGSIAADIARPPGEPGPAAPQAIDPDPRSDEIFLTYANNAALASPMTDGRLDLALREGSYRAARDDGNDDVACCIRVSRQGTAQSFNGPLDVNTMEDLDAVLQSRTARVKVIRTINFCGGPGMNIVGCAYTPGDSIAVVRSNDPVVEGVIWIHEFGHNAGLTHTANPRNIMAASNDGLNNRLEPAECATFHDPSFAARAIQIDIGVCQDSDADGIASSMDNCPNNFNPRQEDVNSNGVGDVCEAGSAPALSNISTRGRVGTDDAVLIGGFIVGGVGSKTLLIRALGPSLSQQGVADPLPDPQLTLFSGPAIRAFNDNWFQSPDANAIVGTGLQPRNNLESAILITLGPGEYTAVVRGAGGAGGVALIEVYDVGGSNTARLTNISTRGRVGTGEDVLIGGFIIGGNEPRTVLVRGIGPTLGSFQVQGTLADPTLELMSGGAPIGQNDDWRDAINAAAIEATGLQPPGDAESAILQTLAPGQYTAIVRGAGGTTGIGLVEIYEIDPGPAPLIRIPLRRAVRPDAHREERRPAR